MRRAWALAFLFTACGGPAPSAPPPHDEPPPPLPAPSCVHDPRADALARARADGTEVPSEGITVGTLDDVDGDSTPEAVVAMDCGAEGGCRRALYFSAHGCTRFAGAMHASHIDVAGGWHRGVRDLQTFDARGCAGLAGAITDWIWDGTTYVDTTTLDCGCPEGTDDAQRAPRCPR